MASLHFDPPPDSICILRLSAIGDVTHVLPIIATLQQHWPNTKITWIIGQIEYQLVKSLAGVEFIVFDKNNGLGEFIRFKKQLAGRRFDILLMMQVALRASAISLLINADTRIGYDKKRSRDLHQLFCNQVIEGPHRVHVLDTFFQFLQKIGLSDRCQQWPLRASDEDQAFARKIIDNKQSIVVNPCSSARKNNWRNWPEDRYAKIIDYLHERGLKVILSGGPAKEESSFSERIVNYCQRKPVNLVGKTTLTQLLALIENSECIIAPDTGPAHLGTVAGKPVIGLFASSNPDRTGPYLSGDHLVNAYPEALEKFTGKKTSTARWGERVRHPQVMQLISTEQVEQRLNTLLG